MVFKVTTSSLAPSPVPKSPLAVMAAVMVMLCMPRTTAFPMTVTEIQRVTMERIGVRTVECSPPDNLHDVFEQLNADNFPEIPPLRPAGFDEEAYQVPSGQNGVLVHQTSVNTTCPAQVLKSETAKLEERSLCPFYLDVLMLPQGYYPQTLSYAQCKCTDCIEHVSFACEKVYTNVTVLRPTGCFRGLQQYEKEAIQIPTSCTCAVRSRITEAPELPYETVTV